MQTKKINIQYRDVRGGKIHIVKDNNFYYCGYDIFHSVDVPIDPSWVEKWGQADVCKNCLKVKNKQKKSNKKKEKKMKEKKMKIKRLDCDNCNNKACNCRKCAGTGTKFSCGDACDYDGDKPCSWLKVNPKCRKKINNQKENNNFLTDIRNIVDDLIAIRDMHIDHITTRQLKIVNEAEELLLDLCILTPSEMFEFGLNK